MPSALTAATADRSEVRPCDAPLVSRPESDGRAWLCGDSTVHVESPQSVPASWAALLGEFSLQDLGYWSPGSRADVQIYAAQRPHQPVALAVLFAQPTGAQHR